MKVGDTFFFEGTEFSIKNIETKFSRKFPTGRVDASKFTGSHDDPENPRTIQRGRPKMFQLSTVAEALGEPIPTPVIKSDVEATEKTTSAWTGIRTDVNSILSEEKVDKPTPSIFNSATDW